MVHFVQHNLLTVIPTAGGILPSEMQPACLCIWCSKFSIKINFKYLCGPVDQHTRCASLNSLKGNKGYGTYKVNKKPLALHQPPGWRPALPH